MFETDESSQSYVVFKKKMELCLLQMFNGALSAISLVLMGLCLLAKDFNGALSLLAMLVMVRSM